MASAIYTDKKRPDSCVVDRFPPKWVPRWLGGVVVVCHHKKQWPEGDAYEQYGGRACEECCEGWCGG